ncbi:MAG TPA: serine/threonine-protein phosphatase [Pseudothauera hydrothermalis]|uniref:PP2C family protein-serine/threonine phosphatase n=1 Tax=Pseudothauera hydrothermalis TaxID=2184083 RepID=UPI000C7AEBC5|nr:PP2C family serine/threonine-protein phosphatase [Pseudothauera hydrothermalis]AUM01100.1 phosphatase [Rhodocyclaceae bacterium]AVZ80267.1 serine/threonine-protein phosphatase [Zoogloeaceae bacteirum Par-f-2]HNQ76956.1 serine/threonine-protein phosphatase [Pseudothauera hydrothermalis]
MKFTIYQESRVGRRKSNQDRIAYCYSRDALLLVLADGMGGHLHGEVAAQIAVQFITQAFQREALPLLHDPSMFLSRALANAHNAILDYAFDKDLPEAPRTTVVACVVQEGQAQWAHAGDSRLYLLRGGRIIAQTRDHSRVQLMMDQGLLDAQSASRHPGRNRIYSCLGGSHPPQVEFSKPVALRDNDTLALCSDGLWGPLGDAGILLGLSDTFVQEAVPRLMDKAEQLAGAGCDNLSLIAVRWHDDSAPLSADSVSTQTMAMNDFATKLDSFELSRTPANDIELTDDEIERAIAEINAAIQKFSK